MSAVVSNPSLHSGVFPVTVAVGNHTFTRHSPRLTVLAYHGDVEDGDIAHISRLVDELPHFHASVILTDVTHMARFTSSARRRLAELRFGQGAGNREILLAIAGADVAKRAAMTVAITAARLTTPSRIESMFCHDLERCLESCRAWLRARPE